MKIGNFLNIGPATMVTAAFIGPGTVITASLAGANFGYALLWALLFSVCASMILQEMAARLGIVTQRGLGENIRESFQRPVARWFAIALVISAIFIGNAAYQGGNIAGAAVGVSAFSRDFFAASSDTVSVPAILITAIAFLLLWSGNYRLIERALIFLVALMSLAFLATFAVTRPDFGALFSGLLVPGIPSGAALTVIALIGTTVVPYNLFLHSASVSEKWRDPRQLSAARRDLAFSIPLGGLISIAILATAASAFFQHQIEVQRADELAGALAPLFGSAASTLLGIGLFAAGISSALTAPLAAAYAMRGILGLRAGLDSAGFRLAWLAVLLSGGVIASLGVRPVEVIWFAQVANGLLLPVVTAFLLWEMNTSRLGEYRNNRVQNLLGCAVLLVTVLLGGRSLLSAFGVI
ncbi:Divalent metal cation transporter MntH [Microbulbifer aggregans]|uniref:Divalent metal cation transporter MntH n=1 Tax=Microbulbifer aggregans TaxID=1769779 RepID=A0A1C9W6V0_9GAMM|nr:Nramp family divalent metal transporter [Microbulbifer aggregans]AOS96858.1 Divalent metal cation transporter MntH [Microbulbifer aggregans]